MCDDLDGQLSLGVDTEIFVITSSVLVSTFSEGIRVSIIHPVPPLACLLGGCIDNESPPRTISAGEIQRVLRGREDLIFNETEKPHIYFHLGKLTRHRELIEMLSNRK